MSLSRSIEGLLNSYLNRKHEKIREQEEDWERCFVETVMCDKKLCQLRNFVESGAKKEFSFRIEAVEL